MKPNLISNILLFKLKKKNLQIYTDSKITQNTFFFNFLFFSIFLFIIIFLIYLYQDKQYKILQ